MTDTSEIRIGKDRAATIERLVDSIATSRLRSLVAILIVAFVAFLPGFQAIAPLDRDEARYAVETKLMVETGGIDERSGVRSLFPPSLVNWLELASVSLVGGGSPSPIWIYRLPALAGATAAVLLTWWMALAFGRPRSALFAAVLFATTPLLVAEAHLAKADAILIAAITLSQGALARLWKSKSDEPNLRLAFLFWTGLAIGILVKEAVAPLVVGLTVAVLVVAGGSPAWLRRLAPLRGALWFGAIIVVWFVAGTIASGASVPEALLPARMAVQEVYEAPPGTYAVLFYPLFGPAGVFVALAIPGVVDRIGRPVFLFAVAWVAPFWMIAELWPAKLPYYILPAFPALALVGATAIDEGWLRISGWISTYFSFNLLVWPALVAIGATVLFFLGEERLPILALPLFLVAVAAGIVAFFWFFRGNAVVGSASLSILSALALYVGLFGFVFSGLGAMQVSSRLVDAGTTSVSCDDPEFVSTGYFEPSLVFYAGADIQFTAPGEAADFLAEGGCKVAFVESRRQSIFNQRTDDIGLELNVQREIRGFNIGNWKLIKMRVFAVEGPPA